MTLVVKIANRRQSKLTRLDTKELFEGWGIKGLQIELEKKPKIRTTIVHSEWDFPIKFNVEKDLKSFRNSGVMRKIDIKKLAENFEKFFYRKRTEKLITLLFWIIFSRKFPKNVRDTANEGVKLADRLRTKMSKHYTKLLYELPHPKTEIMDYILFCSIFICYLMFYRTFVEDREQLKLVFLYEIYHICLFEINGVIVSDTYISHSLERIFNQKMMEYSKELNDENEPNSKDTEDKFKYEYKTPSANNFLGFPLTETNIGSDESNILDVKDHASFKEKLKNKLTPRVVKFEPFGNKKPPTKENLAIRSSSQKKEASILLELNNDKSKVLREMNTLLIKKNKKGKKKNFLTPLKGDDIDIDLIIDSAGLAGKKFHCGQVSPRIREYLGVATGSLVNDKKEIYFHRMRANKNPQTYVNTTGNPEIASRMLSSDPKFQKLDIHQILIEKLVRTTMRKNDMYFKNDVFNKYAFLISEDEVIKKQTKLVEDLLGNKLTLDDCDAHMQKVISNQGFLKVRDLNDNQEYFKYFKKHIYNNKKPVSETEVHRKGEYRRLSFTAQEQTDDKIQPDNDPKSKTSIGFNPINKRFHSPQSGASNGSLHVTDRTFDFLGKDEAKATGTIDRLVFKRAPTSEVMAYTNKIKSYQRKYSPILQPHNTDEKISGLIDDLEVGKDKLGKRLKAIKIRSKSPFKRIGLKLGYM